MYGLKEELEELQARASDLENCDNVQEYDAMLDEVYGEATIAGMEYQTSRVLEEVDPTAYRCGHTDFNDSMLAEVNQEIEAKQEEIDEEEANNRRERDENKTS